MGALLSAVRFLVLLWLFLSRPHRSHALLGSEEFHPLCKQPSRRPGPHGEPRLCPSRFLLAQRPASRIISSEPQAPPPQRSGATALRLAPGKRVEGRVRLASCALLSRRFLSFAVLQCPAVCALAVFFGRADVYGRRERPAPLALGRSVGLRAPSPHEEYP